MIQMVFTTIEECQNCLNQININKKKIPPNTVDVVHEWFNINHPDYIEGYRVNIMKPTGGLIIVDGIEKSRWLANCEQFTWVEKEEDSSWYEKIFPPEEPDLII